MLTKFHFRAKEPSPDNKPIHFADDILMENSTNSLSKTHQSNSYKKKFKAFFNEPRVSFCYDTVKQPVIMSS